MANDITPWDDAEMGGPAVPKNFAKLPLRLSKVVGSIGHGRARWVVWHWDPLRDGSLVCDDGEDYCRASKEAQETWNENLANELRKHNCDCGANDGDSIGPHVILLDRTTGCAWIGPRLDVLEFHRKNVKYHPA